MFYNEGVCMCDFETALGYQFRDKSLLRTSFTHSSYAYENGTQSNERLEFLGDAVLEMYSSLYLYSRFPAMTEGELTKLRAAAVCEPSLARAARGLGLGECLLLGRGEDTTGGRERDSLLSDAMEAVIGAVLLDGGQKCARSVIETLLVGYIEELASGKGFGDHKTLLQEVLQRESRAPIGYRIVGEHGPDHNKVFTAEVRHGERVLGRGEGKNKKEAEQQAARSALEALGV